MTVQFAPLAPGSAPGCGAAYDSSNIWTGHDVCCAAWAKHRRLVFPGGPEITVNNGYYPTGVATDAAGNVYMSALSGRRRVRLRNRDPAGMQQQFLLQAVGQRMDSSVRGTSGRWRRQYLSSGRVPQRLLHRSTGLHVLLVRDDGGQRHLAPSAVALDGAGDIYIGSVFNGASLYQLPCWKVKPRWAAGSTRLPGWRSMTVEISSLPALCEGTTLEVPSVGTQTTLRRGSGVVCANDGCRRRRLHRYWQCSDGDSGGLRFQRVRHYAARGVTGMWGGWR